LKLSETYEPFLPWFRESELRHGRTAMLAVMGFIATDFVRLPGEMYSFESIPKTVDAHDILVEKGPMVQLLMWVGLFDLIITAPACAATMKGEREPGGTSLSRVFAFRVFVCLLCFSRLSLQCMLS
jgi:light-harvesting complex I chlorophyll a/b binding protein 1